MHRWHDDDDGIWVQDPKRRKDYTVRMYGTHCIRLHLRLCRLFLLKELQLQLFLCQSIIRSCLKRWEEMLEMLLMIFAPGRKLFLNDLPLAFLLGHHLRCPGTRHNVLFLLYFVLNLMLCLLLTLQFYPRNLILQNLRLTFKSRHLQLYLWYQHCSLL